MASARMIGLSTVVPPHVIDQNDAAELAVTVFGGRGLRAEAVRSLFANSAIRQRASARPFDWYRSPHDWPDRNAAYLDAADDLFVEAASAAFTAAGIAGRDVGAVVTVSSTGIATPSLEARVGGRLGLASGVRRTPVFGLGCGGGVAGLALAERLARADPGRPVPMVALALCTHSFRPDEATKKNLGVVLTVDLPPFVARRCGEAADAFLPAAGLSREAVGRFVCHPGGAKVLPALEACLGLAEGALTIEREVLAEFGNMSSPTALFVLERVLARGVEGPLVLTALGPGFSAHFCRIDP